MSKSLAFWQIVCTQRRQRRRTVLDLLDEDTPPRFFPRGTPYPFAEKGRCRWCGGLVAPPRQTWCSEACVREWCVRSSGSFVRSYVFERDRGVCAECGVQDEYVMGRWDADHIVPVWRGGGLCGLDGYQTLCKTCHAVKTAEDAGERATLRRPEPEPLRQMAMAL